MKLRMLVVIAVLATSGCTGGDDSVSDTTTSTTAPISSLEWSRVPHDEVVFGGQGTQSMNGVAVGGPGLVAVGSDDSGGDADAAVWSSRDGISWSRVPYDEVVFGGQGTQFMQDVAAGGPGLVAVGSDDSGGDADAAVWSSRDGISWSRVPHDEVVFGGQGHQVMVHVAVGGPGLVAVGSDESGGDVDAAVWSSRDGISWSRVPHDEAVFGGQGSQAMLGVTAGGPGLVAVGFDESGASADAAVWSSRDGISWSRVPRAGALILMAFTQRMFGVTAGGPGVVAVGPNEFGGGVDAEVWTSPDGISWSWVPPEAEFGGQGNQWMLGVAARGPGLVAVGADESGGDLDAAAWTSPDGISWSRVPHDEAEFGGQGNQWMLGVAARGPGLVAVGTDLSGGDAVVWVAARED